MLPSSFRCKPSCSKCSTQMLLVLQEFNNKIAFTASTFFCKYF